MARTRVKKEFDDPVFYYDKSSQSLFCKGCGQEYRTRRHHYNCTHRHMDNRSDQQIIICSPEPQEYPTHNPVFFRQDNHGFRCKGCFALFTLRTHTQSCPYKHLDTRSKLKYIDSLEIPEQNDLRSMYQGWMTAARID